MSFFRRFKIFTGMLFGPDDLWEPNDDIIIKEISFLFVGVKNNYLCLYWIGNLYYVWVKI